MSIITEYEVESAYDKLRNYYYFEKTDLITRKKIFDWDKSKISEFTSELNDFDNTLEKYIDSIGINPFPKSFNDTQLEYEKNFYTNHRSLKSDSISNFLVFINAPVEVHIISVIWTVRFGVILDRQLSENCYGNRIYNNSYKPKQLFEKYQHKYKHWWNNALNATKGLLSQKKNSTVFCFDIKSYFHSIEVSFNELNAKLKHEINTDFDRRVFRLLYEIHFKYKRTIRGIAPSISDSTKHSPLPIGLMSSFVIANYHLLELDNEIKLTSPTYYGRYVDDIIIVFEGIGRPRKSKKSKFLCDKLSGVLEFSDKNEEIIFVNSKYRNLEIQSEKVHVYDFNYKSSPTILTAFVEDQRKKSSEFRYLSDILDNNFDEFEGVVFEDNFDFENGNNAKIKDVNENKFKIASYLSKLTRKVIDHGESYKDAEIEKVFRFFSGKFLLYHFVFWEKLLTLYHVSGKSSRFKRTVKDIVNVIDSIKIHSKWKVDENLVKETLKNNLNIAISLSTKLSSAHLNFQVETEDAGKHLLPRDHYSIFPFLPYTTAYTEYNVSLLDYNALNQFINNPEALRVLPELVPTGKPFYWCYLSVFIYNLYNEDITEKTQDKILKEAFSLYKEINRCDIPRNELYSINEILSNKFEDKTIFEITVSKAKSQKCRSAIVNEIVSLKNFSSSLNNRPLKSNSREEKIRFELDQLSKIPKLDIAVKPELSIPIFSLFKFVQHSAKFQYSLNSGIEYIPTKTLANNCILCTLPVKVGNEFLDCVPVIRLKNDYSYEEISSINNKRKLAVPKLTNKEFYLFRSNGIYFSNYYCFELTSIENRAIFKSMVDLIVAPVWNKDNFYFKAISETMVRDLHCFYAQSNTSEFADSRMIQPTKSTHVVKSLVKGGTISQSRYNFSLLIDDIDLKKYRDFQMMDYESTQNTKFKKNNIFKPLPPDFVEEYVLCRIENESINNAFLYDDTIDYDENLDIKNIF